MAAMNLPVHIPPDASPSNILNLLAALATNDGLELSSVSELIEFSAGEGLSTRTEVPQMATQLGLLTRTPDGICLSERGQVLIELKPTIRGDILHFLLYTGWQSTHPVEFLPSWTYRLVCDDYWDRQDIELDGAFVERRVAEIVTQAEQYFRGLGIGEFNEVSFGEKSMRGLRKWLDVLTPSVIEDNHFTRRSFCPPELLLLALGWVVGQEGLPETDVLLSRETRDAVCRACLLEPTAFDRALDWMLPIFPRVIAPGTTAGFYGRFVRLHKLPELADVVR